jgi:hypothetical protein
MEIVNVTPGNPNKSSLEQDAARAVKVNTSSDSVKFPEIPDQPSNVETLPAMTDEETIARKRIEEYMALPPDQRKARVAAVFDRGLVHDRLKVDLPPDLHGEWVRSDPFEVDRMRTLGYWLDNTYSTKRAIHSDGTSANKVADVVFMVTLKDNKKLIDQVRLERQLRSMNNPRSSDEDKQFMANTAAETGGIIPTFSESKQQSVDINDVRAALARADAQTQVR